MAKISVGEAAELLACSPMRVRQLLAQGVLQGDRRGRVWFVDSESVDARRHASKQPGRPMLERSVRAFVGLLNAELGYQVSVECDELGRRAQARLRARRSQLAHAHEPGLLLRSWLPHRSERRGYRFFGDPVELLDDVRLHRSGLSDPSFDLAAAGVVEAHLETPVLEAVEAEWDLVDDQLRPNVWLHVEERILGGPASSLADIADHGGPREEALVRDRLVELRR